MRLALAFALTATFMLVEFVGGWIANSLALIADGGHMLTDAAALALALAAVHISDRPADARRTFGYHRMQVLAAFVNGLGLVLIAAWIAIEAAVRLMAPEPVEAGPMMAIALGGLLVNGVVFLILHGGQHDNLNVRGALAHVMGDLLGSVAAIAAAAIILLTGWMAADPLLSVVVAALILRTGWRLTRETAHILLEGAPDSLDPDLIESQLRGAVPGLISVHHVHSWLLTPERRMVTLHAVLDVSADGDRTTARIIDVLRHSMNVVHTTVQIERSRCADHPRAHDPEQEKPAV